MKDEHVKDAAQGVAECVPQDAAQDLAFGARAARAARALPATPRHRRRRLCAARAEMRAQLGSYVCGIWLGLWASASGGAAQSASMLI